MATGPIQDDMRDDNKVNLRENESVKDLDDLLASAEYEASVFEQGGDEKVKQPKEK